MEVSPTNAKAYAVKINKISIIGIYQPPNRILANEDMDKIVAVGEKLIIVGDFNSRHTYCNCNTNNNNGENLLRLTVDYDLIIHAPAEATHIPNNGKEPTIIDLAITKAVNSNEIHTINTTTYQCESH